MSETKRPRTMGVGWEKILRGCGEWVEYNFPAGDVWAELDAERAACDEALKELADAKAERSEALAQRDALAEACEKADAARCTCSCHTGGGYCDQCCCGVESADICRAALARVRGEEPKP